MRSTRAVLSVQVTKVSGRASAAISGFLNYVQHRDHSNNEREQGFAGLVKYVAHRDAASPEGRLFDRDGRAGTKERRTLVKYVGRSLADLPAGARPGRAVYRLVLSPEDSRGLDLRQAARSTMAQLERDTGSKLPPWIAAEHRNTAHPHVHIVMAARREVEPGRFREVRITKPRLARMKLAMTFELEGQRDARAPHRSLEERLLEAAAPRRRSERQRSTSHIGWFRRSPMQRFLLRLAAQQRREMERLEREIERERRERGWER